MIAPHDQTTQIQTLIPGERSGVRAQTREQPGCPALWLSERVSRLDRDGRGAMHFQVLPADALTGYRKTHAWAYWTARDGRQIVRRTHEPHATQEGAAFAMLWDLGDEVSP